MPQNAAEAAAEFAGQQGGARVINNLMKRRKDASVRRAAPLAQHGRRVTVCDEKDDERLEAKSTYSVIECMQLGFSQIASFTDT